MDPVRVRLRPLWGEGADEPLCSVLEVDGCTLLLDCGSTERFDLAALEPLRELAPSVDAVLLSHADLAHLGGLPYAYGHLGLRCPVYATLPVWKMGQMFLYDAYQARATECGGAVDGFDLDDVDAAFEHITQLKYAQLVRLRGARGRGISITPLPAGRTLGGAIWRVRKETETVLYAVDFGHTAERLLLPAALEEIQRPSALIVSAHAISREAAPLKQRVSTLVEATVTALRAGGSVLLPVDTAARSLELVHTLASHWANAKLGHYPLVFLGHTSYNTLEFAKSQMEWMSDAVIRRFDVSGHALSFRGVIPCTSLEELDDLAEAAAGPMAVCVSTEACDMGLSRAAIAQWLAEPRRLVLFTSPGPPGSVARRLTAASEPPATVLLPRWRRAPLTGPALDAWRARRAAAQRARDEAAAAEEREALAAAAAAMAGAPGAEAGAPAATVGGVYGGAGAAADGAEGVLRMAAAAAAATSVEALPLMPYREHFPRRDEWGEEVRSTRAPRRTHAARARACAPRATARRAECGGCSRCSPARALRRSGALAHRGRDPRRVRARPQVSEPEWGRLAKVAAEAERSSLDGASAPRDGVVAAPDAGGAGGAGALGADAAAANGTARAARESAAPKPSGAASAAERVARARTTDGSAADDDAADAALLGADGEQAQRARLELAACRRGAAAAAAAATEETAALDPVAHPAGALASLGADAAVDGVPAGVLVVGAGGAAAEPAPLGWVEGPGEEISVRCRVRLVPMDGHCDARAFKALLARAAPGALALLRGTASDKARATAVATRAGVSRALTPSVRGPPLDLSSGVHMTRISLPDTLLSATEFQQVGGYEVARVRGVLHVPSTPDSTAPDAPALAGGLDAAAAEMGGGAVAEIAPPTAGGDVAAPAAADGGEAEAAPAAAAAGDPMEVTALQPAGGSALPPRRAGTHAALAELRAAPAAQSAMAPSSAGTLAATGGSRALSFVAHGDLRLSDFRQTLARAGYRAEFVSGVLVVNGKVRLRKAGPRKVALDGVYGDDYFAVRQLLYSQFRRI